MGGLEDGDAHAVACRTAAEWIANILRWQTRAYGLVSEPSQNLTDMLRNELSYLPPDVALRAYLYCSLRIHCCNCFPG